jgi:hypothetical protein
VQESGRGGVASEAERGVRKKGKKMTSGPRVSERRERGGLLLAWAGQAAGPGGRERAKGVSARGPSWAER